ncbi:hypothetical protein ACHAXS_010498 [Conticribra weissflogii]
MSSSYGTNRSSSSSTRKRTPFCEAPRDISNRIPKTSSASRVASASAASKHQHQNQQYQNNEQLVKPPMLPHISSSSSSSSSTHLSGSGRNSGINAIATKKTQSNLMRSTSASRARIAGCSSGEQQQQDLPPPTKSQRRSSSTSRQRPPVPSATNSATGSLHSTGTSADTRARMYKAEAYEAKVRVAAQEQRIESLKAELDELRFFHEVEGGHGLENDGNDELQEEAEEELIERLAADLDYLENDLKMANERNVQLQEELENTAKFQKELEKSRKDVEEGMTIMKDLSKALQSTRSEKEKLRSEKERVLREMEDLRGEMEEMKRMHYEEIQQHQQKQSDQQHNDNNSVDMKKYQELHEANAELQNVLTVVQSQSEKKLQKMKESLNEAQAREKRLENDHQSLLKKYESGRKECAEMEETLDKMSDKFEHQKKEAEKHVAAMKELEEKHKLELQELKKRHEDDVIEKVNHAIKQGSSKLARSQKVHEIKMAEKEKDHEAALAALKENHAAELVKKEDHLKSIEAQWQSRVSELERQHSEAEYAKNELKEELARSQSKNKAFGALESNYLSEIKSLKNTITDLHEAAKKNDFEKKEKELEEAASSLRRENSKLKVENATLSNKMIEEKAILDCKLNEKEGEVQDLRSQLNDVMKEKDDLSEKNAALVKARQADTNLAAVNKKLKQDLLAAVESSISRAKEIQILKKEVQISNTKLAKVTQQVKELEKSAALTPPVADSAISEEEKILLESEIFSLKSKAWEAEDTISGLEQEISLLRSKVSRSEKLERELESSRAQVMELTEAVEEMESLKDEIENSNTKLVVATEKLKKLERFATMVPSIDRADSQEETNSFEFEISSLKLKAYEAEDKIVDLEKEISHLRSKASRAESLERDLLNSRAQITELTEAVQDMEIALEAVSRHRLGKSTKQQVAISSVSSNEDGSTEGRESLGDDREKEEKKKRQAIENDILKEYFIHRMNIDG